MVTTSGVARSGDRSGTPWRGQAAGTGAAVLVRVAILAQLVVAGVALDEGEFHLVAVALGLSAAAQVLTDSGAAAFLSVLDGERESVPLVARRLLLWQIFVGCTAFALSTVLLLRVADTAGTWTLLGLLAVLATSAVESVGRLCRVVWLRQGRYRNYAGTDVAYALARLLPVLLLVAGGGAWAFVAGLVLAVGVTCSVGARVSHELWRDRVMGASGPAPGLLATVRGSLSYGLPVMAAGLYSQTPVLVTSAVSSLETASAVAVATRLVQPLELVAASWSQMSLPGLARAHVARGRFLGVLLAQGAVVAVAGACGVALFLHLGDAGPDVWLLSAVLLVALPVKYLNYGLATLLMALGRPDVRTWTSVVLGLSCTTVLLWVADQSVAHIGLVVGINEVVLASALAAAVRLCAQEHRAQHRFTQERKEGIRG